MTLEFVRCLRRFALGRSGTTQEALEFAYTATAMRAGFSNCLGLALGVETLEQACAGIVRRMHVTSAVNGISPKVDRSSK